MYTNRIKLGILENHPLVIKGLVSLFENCADISIVGAYEDSDELFESMLAQQHAVIVTEYFLDTGDRGGAELIQSLIDRHPRTRILIFSASHDPSIVALALRLGAHGYVNKQASDEIILRALRRVQAGGRYIDPALQHLLPDRLAPIVSNEASGDYSESRFQALLSSAKLSPGEHDVLRSLAAGSNVMEIAAQLRKSPKTISTQKAAAFRKLGVTTNNGLYRLVGKTVDSAQRAGARTKSRSGMGQC